VALSAPVDPGTDIAPGAGDSHITVYVLGGLGALALALAVGFVWYRHRLP